MPELNSKQLIEMAKEQEKIKESLSRHAYSLLKDNTTVADTIEVLTTLNEPTDYPLNNDELEQIVRDTQAEIKTKKDKYKEEKDNTIYTSFLETEEYLIEQIFATRATRATTATDTEFLLYEKKTSVITYSNEITISNYTYRPIINNILTRGVVLLPTGIEEYNTDKELIEEISNFLNTYFQVPSFYEKFLPYLVMFYWVSDKFPFVPYLHFIGLTGTGKTTAQEVVGSICYKPIDASGSITMSPIFRVANDWHGTLLLDEFEPNSEGYSEMMAFLKSGVSNKALLRTEGDRKREVEPYLVKSPKIFTSEQPINNAGLQSRTIVIRMEKNKRKVPLYRLGEFLKEAQVIRNKLLLWRLRNYCKLNLEEIKMGYEELQSFDGRVQQVITPIYHLADEETKAKIIEFAEVQEAETKKERAESLEGFIFQCILDGTFALTAITNEINNAGLTNRKITEKKVAALVRKVFQFSIKRLGHENVNTVITDGQDEKIEELCQYFGYPPQRVASVASVANEDLDSIDALENATRSATQEELDYNVSQTDSND